MNFEEMKVVWDSQNARPMFAVDETALHAGIRRSSRKFRDVIVVAHLAIVGTWAALGGWYLAAPLLEGEQLHRLVSGGVLLALAAGQVAALLRRRNGEAGFDGTLRGDLDLAVWRIDYDMAWARALRRWYLLPFVAALLLDVVVRPNPMRLLAGAAVVVLIGGASIAMDWEIRSMYMPRKRRFEEIRRKLVDAER